MNFQQAKSVIKKSYGISVRGHDILKFAKENTDKIIHAKYIDNCHSVKPDILGECAFEGCIFGEVSVRGEQIILKLDIWDGDSYYGTPINKATEYKLAFGYLPPIIESSCHYALKTLVESQIAKEDEEAKQLRIKIAMENFLASA